MAIKEYGNGPISVYSPRVTQDSSRIQKMDDKKGTLVALIAGVVFIALGIVMLSLLVSGHLDSFNWFNMNPAAYVAINSVLITLDLVAAIAVTLFAAYQLKKG